jgi:protein-L-isoaspartate O-methyltransferase
MPIGDSKEQKLLVVTKTNTGFVQEFHDEVAFVPMLPGKSNDGNN